MRHCSVDQMVTALKIQSLSQNTSIKNPTFDKEGNVGLFDQQFQDVAEINEWMKRKMLLRLRNALPGKAKEHGCGDSVKEVLDSLMSQYGRSM